MRRAAGLLAAALALAIAGCDGGPLGLPNFVFSVESSGIGGGPTGTATAFATESGIRVEGTIGTPDPCYEIDGRAVPGPGGIEVRVTGERDGDEACPSVPGSSSYEGILLGPAPGTYHVTVRHIVRSNSTIAFEGDVRID